MSNQAILLTAFKAMPNNFTSREFHAAAREAGADPKALRNGGGRNFLAKMAICPHFGSRVWEKMEHHKSKPTPAEPNQLTEDTCIAFLKERGYKIFKEIEL